MLVLPAELTHQHGAACCRMLEQGVRTDPGTVVVVDASALSRFDSSAIAVLLDCRREALAVGKSFSVKALPPRLRVLAGLYGVADLLPATA